MYSGHVNRCCRFIAAAFLLCLTCAGAPKRILYVTATYGFRHDSIPTSIEVFNQLARESGIFEVVHTEDVSLLNAAYLRDFDAVYFFTSGELPLSDQQKADLLDFVRQGKGFGGSHSATDCLYSWPDYGDLIGGYFDGHPWAQEASVDVEDPQSPLVSRAAPSFRFTEEFYQFRAFSRDRVRVLLTLDTRSVNLQATGINRDDGDFALAWIRNYGKGRAFYSAFGHFNQSFQLDPVKSILNKALLWLVGAIDIDATPRSGPSAAPPAIAINGVGDLAGTTDAFAPGGIVAITGERLTSGSFYDAATTPLPVRLAGTHVEVNGIAAPLFSVRPGRLLVQLPASLPPGQPADLTVSSATRSSQSTPLRMVAASPAIVAAVSVLEAIVVYATGLGIAASPTVRANGQSLPVFFSGLAPGFIGLYQINVSLPRDAPSSLDLTVEAEGRISPAFPLKR